MKTIGQDGNGGARVIDLQHRDAPGQDSGIAGLPLHDGHHRAARRGIGEKRRGIGGRADRATNTFPGGTRR